MEYLPISQIQAMQGLRIVACANVPSPWSLAARALFDYKKLPYVLGEQLVTKENAELQAWTGQNSAPVVAYRKSDDNPNDNEKLASSAEGIILLAEKLEPTLALIPADPEQRAWMFGLLQSLTGEDGFAWCRRLMSLGNIGQANMRGDILQMALKYDYSDQAAAKAGSRAAEILRVFSNTLNQQQAKGSDFLVGSQLSALDFYFAIFIAVMYKPLPNELLPMSDGMRAGYELGSDELDAAADQILFDHRDKIFAQSLTVPISY